ncbi:MAG: nucleotidyltransferase domain-containing protein [Nanoarchaeota archaeon]
MDNITKDIINKIKKLKYVSCIFLFGSQINGKARKDSDIDIAILIKDASEKQILDVIGYSSPKIDISIFSKLPLIIQFRILKEGKIMFCRDERYLYDIKVDVFRKYLDYSYFINRFYKRVIKNV